MKIYYDTNSWEEKIYTDFNDLCEALREAHEEYMQDEENKSSLEEWVKSLIDNGITVHEVPDEVETAYFNSENGQVYTNFGELEEEAIIEENFPAYVNDNYTAMDIFEMREYEKNKIDDDFANESWNWFFDAVCVIYKIYPKSKEIKECYCYDDLWD